MTTMQLVYVAAIAALLVDPSAAINCQSNRCTARGKQNILCQFPNPNPSPNCGEVLSSGVTEYDIADIVSAMNQIRFNVSMGLVLEGNPGHQPPAADMQPLSWDDELATMAQRWSNQCQSEIVDCTDVSRFAVGDSGGVISTGGPTLDAKPTDIIKFFFSDVQHMNRDDVFRFPENSKSKLYTQLVWAKSSKVGCGPIKYKANDGIIRYLMTCLYGPRGNIVGEPVYTTWAV